jgi:hypothetical protein
MTVRALVLVCALAVAGCAAGPTDTASPAATAGRRSTAADPSAVLVTFRRQGGLLGVDDTVTVRADGSYQVGPGKTGRLSAAEVAELRGLLDRAQIGTLPSVNRTEGVADGYTYRVRYGGREIMAEDGAVPAALEPVIAALNRLLSQ